RAESEDGQNDGTDDHQNRHQQAAASAVRTANEPDPASAVTASISTARAPADRAPAEAAPAPESATVPARRGGYEKKHRKQNPSDQCCTHLGHHVFIPWDNTRWPTSRLQRRMTYANERLPTPSERGSRSRTI